MTLGYQEFLAAKQWNVEAVGKEVLCSQINPTLFEFQKDIVAWACRLGKAAIWADCGLGKTFMQLEWARLIDVPTLIVAPLSVAQQTIAEGRKLGIDVVYSRDGRKGQITICNYEMIEKFNPADFEAVVLDESSILKSIDGKTRSELIEMFSRTPYRLACTATPAPNDYMELGNHAQFLGVMTLTEMLAMFFTHDGGETQKWRLKGHAQDEFWKWLSSWSVTVRKPSDLGYDDGDFSLPELSIDYEDIPVDYSTAHEVGMLFPSPVTTLQEQREVRRGSLARRVLKAAELAINDKKNQWLIWCELNDEGDELENIIPESVQVKGSDSIESKEEHLMAFARGEIRVLISKPSICGFGMNFQNCHKVCFVGLSHSYEMFYQAVRRCWRFGQRESVSVHVIGTDLEKGIFDNVMRKEESAIKMADEMAKHVKSIQIENIGGTARTKAVYQRQEKSEPKWTMHLGDCVEVIGGMADESIDYTIFSPPFASLYTYSNSERDMGNCKNKSEFYDHFSFVVTELLRVTKPGRCLSFHCMNLPTSKVRDGHIGVSDFRGDLIRMFTDAGWIYHSEVCIWKDPVMAMQRTKAIGLLWKQLKKDSTISRMGIPDYLVTVRKPGENPEPVEHTPEEFPVKQWQQWASPIWTDIDPSDTLNFRSAREDKDERHICPLQLEVIRRALILWSNEGDLVLSPFAGIGSEGYVSLLNNRRFVGVELKRSYYDMACQYLTDAEKEAGKAMLF